ncbi:hypothetical protein G6F37_003370 [Rhizopus arrhizus]|nr:hypothetical protein G6F38_003040 [Rhizopus arrhizus]KAG1161105.1 hypothetical protein G6F37_003370 [Rhizopus arrhizus]
MIAVATQLSASNAVARSKKIKNTSATVSNNVTDSLVTETLSTKISQYAPKSTTNVADTAKWITTVKEKKTPKHRVLTSTFKRSTTARAFPTPSTEFTGYDIIYIFGLVV